MLGRLRSAFRGRDTDYDLLPTSEWSTSRPNGGGGWRYTLRWRGWRRCSLTVLLVAILGAGAVIGMLKYCAFTPPLFRTKFLAHIFGPKPLPPLYPEFVDAEMALPQHHVQDPFANGQKYLWVASHTQWSGWGNYMQDMVLTAHLTYRTGRTYVFDDFTWDKNGPPYSKFDRSRWIPSRIPLTAVISGPIAGGKFPDGDDTPRAISKRYWDKICPHPTTVDAAVVRDIHGGGSDAVRIEETWIEYLSKIDDPCVEVIEESGSMFHVFMFGKKEEMLPVWPYLKHSPILKLFGWSSLAHHAFEANRALFSPAAVIPPQDPHPGCPTCVDRYAPLDGLLAVHLRRGDFATHCPNLCHWGANFNAFNRFPEFVDPWDAPQGDEDARMAVYMQRCLPTVEQIVAKIEEVRASGAGRGLRNIYVMTNGEKEWLEELKAALWKAYPWQRIATSRDTVLTDEQKYVAQSMDMLVGERAQVYIGNGFSSLSSNIAMLRMSKELNAESTRMW